MNDIRYRAWHKTLKVMIYPHSPGDSFHIAQVNNKRFHIEVENTVDKKMVKIPFHENMTWTGLNYQNGTLQNLIFQQYIGLGAYEDDIIEFDDTQIGGPKGRGRVIYCNDLTLVSAPGWYLEMPDHYILTHFPFKFKVIGNIYENPGLFNEACLDKEGE